MRKRPYRLVAIVTLLLVAATFLVWDGRGAFRTIEEMAAEEAKLIDGKCTRPESIDRWLLQQSWFYDDQFTQLAGAFGQSSFTLFQNGDTERRPIEGAYCIDGNDLFVRYFESRLVPVALRPTELTIDFGTKLRALGEDTYTVRELTRDRMVLTFASDGRDHVFYRKN